MKLNVPPTRMSLLRLKKRIKIAKRGHKLLKDKFEELMRHVYGLVDEIKLLRKNVDKKLREVFYLFSISDHVKDKEYVDVALSYTTKKISLEINTRRILNLKVPVFKKSVSGSLINYGFYQTNALLDKAMLEMEELIDVLLELAEKEKTLELLSEEIERTRRRVNALEFVVIPNISETIQYIKLKLNEAERGNLTRLMRVKETIRK